LMEAGAAWSVTVGFAGGGGGGGGGAGAATGFLAQPTVSAAAAKAISRDVRYSFDARIIPILVFCDREAVNFV